MWDMLDEEPDEGSRATESLATEAPPSAPWEDALAQLNRYPWPRLSLLSAHPDFREAILAAVASHEEGGAEQVTRWRELLG